MDTGVSQEPGRSVNSSREATRSGKTGEPGQKIFRVVQGRSPTPWAAENNGGTVRYRLTRDNRRRPKEVADVGVTQSTAVGGEPRPKGATVGKGEPGIIAQCVDRPDGPLEPTNGLTNSYWIAQAGRAANGDARGAGYVSCVRPDLWGGRRSNPPTYPTQDPHRARQFQHTSLA